MRLASVSPVAKSDHWIVCPAPITWVTAIASPSARPRPSITAAPMPGFDEESTTPLTISQRVAPSASAPSSSSSGTLRKSSRQTLATIGTTMIARIRPAMKMPLDCGVPPKSGRHPRGGGDEAEVVGEPGLGVVGRERPEHEDPPEPEHHAWHRGQRLDERADHAAD